MMKSGRESHPPGQSVAVQRCGAIPADRCPCHDAETDARAPGRATLQRLTDGETSAANLHPTVRVGSRGEPVFELQVKLNLEGTGPYLAADSIFGPKTDRAVRAFQSDQDLERDGIAGPRTWAALDAGLALDQPPTCDTFLTALGRTPIGAESSLPVAQAQAVGPVSSSCALIAPDLLAQLVRILGKPKVPPVPPAFRKCTSKTAPDAVIDRHTVAPSVISGPRDKVTFTVAFTCAPADTSAFTRIETAAGVDLGNRQSVPIKGGKLTRTWDGKKLFDPTPKPHDEFGTFMVDDGQYRHRVDPFIFAFKNSANLFVAGTRLISPPVTVDVRARAGALDSKANVALLARIMMSEMGVGNPVEQEAIGWAVRNQMLRMNTHSVEVARAKFGDDIKQAPEAKHLALAKKILSATTMSGDITGGATNWFSPQSMPPRKSNCKERNCRGGPEVFVNSDTGKKETVFVPDFARTMTKRSVSGARDWYAELFAM
jgi:peptidoglycan hydrolase-like protein with peptidoglycan-binding domain